MYFTINKRRKGYWRPVITIGLKVPDRQLYSHYCIIHIVRECLGLRGSLSLNIVRHHLVNSLGSTVFYEHPEDPPSERHSLLSVSWISLSFLIAEISFLRSSYRSLKEIELTSSEIVLLASDI